MIALTLLAAALRFVRLAHQGFWFDEGNTALLVRQSPGVMLSLVRHTESTPPLYYCAAWTWTRLFGSAEYGLRSLSALAGTLTVPVMYLVGTRLADRRTGLSLAALTACNPLLVWYSQEARSYASLVLAGALSLLALTLALERPSRRRMVAWALVAAAALATHYYAALLVVPEAVLLLWRHRWASAGAVAGVGLCGAALLPLAIAQRATGATNWIAAIPLDQRLGQITPNFLAGFQGPAYPVLTRVAAVIAAAAVVALAARERDGSEGARRCALLLLAGLALVGLLLAAGIDNVISRNLIALWVPAAVVVAAGLTSPRPAWGPARVAGIAGVTVICAAGVAIAAGVATQRRWERPDWRLVARLLGTHSAPGVGERAILIQRQGVLLPLRLYLPGLARWPGTHARRVRELDIVTFTAPRAPACWWGAACNLAGSRAQQRYPVAGLHEVWRRRRLQFTVIRLRAGAPVSLSPRTVARALTATRLRSDELLRAP